MMVQKIHLTGELPENWQSALAELRQELGFAEAPDGIEISCRRGEELAVSSDGVSVSLVWQTPIQLWRGLSRIPMPLAPCDIHEKARFETVGLMFDCSRNAVLKPEAMKGFLRKMALQGLNFGMLYTEDTYEVPEQPRL